MKALTPLERMIDEATGYKPPAEPAKEPAIPDLTVTAQELFDVNLSGSERMLVALYLEAICKRRKKHKLARQFRTIAEHHKKWVMG